jgi:hypothetical protein
LDYEQIASNLDGLARDMRDMGDAREDAEILIAAAGVLRRLCGRVASIACPAPDRPVHEAGEVSEPSGPDDQARAGFSTEISAP